MNAFRNLYRLASPAGRVVAFITAKSQVDALASYRQRGGFCTDAAAEQLTRGYPEDVCIIY